MTESLYYVCDLRREWLKKPYVSFWRAKAAGYAFPLSWSGKYTIDELKAEPDYYWHREGRGFDRFPVPCSDVDYYGAAPAPKTIDGNAGPVIWMNKNTRALLRSLMLPLTSGQGK